MWLEGVLEMLPTITPCLWTAPSKLEGRLVSFVPKLLPGFSRCHFLHDVTEFHIDIHVCLGRTHSSEHFNLHSSSYYWVNKRLKLSGLSFISRISRLIVCSLSLFLCENNCFLIFCCIYFRYFRCP